MSNFLKRFIAWVMTPRYVVNMAYRINCESDEWFLRQAICCFWIDAMLLVKMEDPFESCIKKIDS